MKTIHKLLLIASFTATNAFGQGDDIFRATDAAVFGPQQDLDIYGHGFVIKPATIAKEGKKLRLSGQISHALNHTDDDQVYYVIEIQGTKVLSIQQKIEEGGFANMAKPFAC